ncbi:hypothetical protein Kpol_1041p30 [Vanderwaltozyma polyspora DSM 70294]|uniref:Protein SIP5 n=1 Tax=Vanderwaltozyma polyspora (strain ATCC 22028 / DSM 70294 / BCRC 21397 / CBS 2163 / NBRC 10782 / NRRL Y-8283 / UCD 57-17) TaxID=436907 RepID=SIP5_VANPO|nr:uncharacterized protein Kpol_1041p30 [Vanderwaltozyma polyspora DSM 70294]A7TL97.1 RecName: Full=Protein SIP5 [Vanderwaltozyma polyspora DSM 70294]EDO16972.1 hypothetical protein Kpol_1041p30 [Vanderwaltozyma polyspora DSM 70294]
MGNVPTKLEEPQNPSSRLKSSSFSNSVSGNSDITDSPGSGNGRSSSQTKLNNARSKKKNASLSNGLLKSTTISSRKKDQLDREQFKEDHAAELLVKYYESVDGGFLAPFGCYSLEKLNYNPKIVKKLIIERKLAPFYTPLQDFNDNWTDEELIKIIDGLPLHASFNESLEEFEDIPTGDLKSKDFDYLIDSSSLSKREQKKLHSKIFKARLHKKRIAWQEMENTYFLEKKLSNKNILSKSKDSSEDMNNHISNSSNDILNNIDISLPNDDLKLSLYQSGIECPICFLYYPKNLNYSKCCQQPICTECFVQIKRALPHFPHDDNEHNNEDDSEKDPHLLISEPANCPYCATPNFTISYSPIASRKTGINGVKQFYYKPPKANDDANLSNNTAKPVYLTSDTIRPDWEDKLNKERSRLQRRAANATAIHVSNQLISPGRSENNEIPSNLKELENQMIEQAIKLSLQDRKQNESGSRKKSSK